MKPFLKIATILSFFTILISLFTIIISCNSSPIEPEPQPGRRDYVWTVDTVIIPFNNLEKLWANSTNDIWAVGSGGGLDQTIWHYDGIKWKTDGVSRPIAPIAVYGFSANDVWFGGSEGNIWRYNGNQFYKSLSFRPTTNWTYSGFHDFYGNSSADLYAVGWVDSNKVRYGKIFRFNGYNWKMLNISSRGDDFMQIRKGNNDPNYYLWSWRFDNANSDSVKIFSFNGTELREIHRGLMNDTHGAGIETINGRVYFGIDNAVFTYENNAFKQKFAVNNPNFTQGLIGRNEKDIFLSMWDGVAHYNGENIEYIFRENNLVLRDIEVLNNEVILLYTDFSKGLSLIYRGKLK